MAVNSFCFNSKPKINFILGNFVCKIKYQRYNEQKIISFFDVCRSYEYAT